MRRGRQRPEAADSVLIDVYDTLNDVELVLRALR
jgi:hypothetical protein